MVNPVSSTRVCSSLKKRCEEDDSSGRKRPTYKVTVVIEIFRTPKPFKSTSLSIVLLFCFKDSCCIVRLGIEIAPSFQPKAF